MSLISHSITNDYDIFLDADFTKPLKKKAIALADREFYCRKKIGRIEESSFQKTEENPE